MSGRVLGVFVATVAVVASGCGGGLDGRKLVEATRLPCPELAVHTDRWTICTGERAPAVLTVGSRSELVDAIDESGLHGRFTRPPLVVGVDGQGAWAFFVVDLDDAEQVVVALNGEILASVEDFDQWARGTSG